MAYEKQTWINKDRRYPTSADRMAHIEDGIEVAEGAMSMWHTIFSTQGALGLAAPAGTYILRSGTSAVTSGSNQGSVAPQTFYLRLSDYEHPGGRALRFRLRTQVMTNGTTPVTNVTFGLYPVFSSGASTSINYTVGTLVPNSTVLMTSLGVNSVTNNQSSEFAFATEGLHVIGAVTDATLATNAQFHMHVQLQAHWV